MTQLAHANIVAIFYEAQVRGARKGLSVTSNKVEFIARDAFSQVQCSSPDALAFLASIKAYRRAPRKAPGG